MDFINNIALDWFHVALGVVVIILSIDNFRKHVIVEFLEESNSGWHGMVEDFINGELTIKELKNMMYDDVVEVENIRDIPK